MDGCSLNITVSALACAIAKGKSESEISLLAVLFTQLGDSLATIAAGNKICCEQNSAGNNNNITANID